MREKAASRKLQYNDITYQTKKFRTQILTLFKEHNIRQLRLPLKNLTVFRPQPAPYVKQVASSSGLKALLVQIFKILEDRHHKTASFFPKTIPQKYENRCSAFFRRYLLAVLSDYARFQYFSSLRKSFRREAMMINRSFRIC
ncbi:hypothetical protein [Chloroherpeton thalassium]|uniref:hypothetical protein n=1 Tax=Chloroherpeton thalassium TaxID=100716 RepID=UPI00145FB767|nr:hypothetical protein [Chloroherpeton thalassium]